MKHEGRRSATPAAGRRSAVRQALHPTVLLAVLVPVLTIGALALVRPDPVIIPDRAAQEVAPSRTDLVCPSGPSGSEVAVAAAGTAEGEVSSYSRGDVDPTSISLVPDTVTRLSRRDPTFLRGGGAVAPELIGARIAEGPSSTECVLPRPEYWVTGLGAGGDLTSVLELSNPDGGTAVADVTVWGRAGRIDVARLRGVTVPGGDTQRIDLADVLPRRSELAVHVTVSRGRLAATAVDRIAALGSRAATSDWVPTVADPSTEQLLLGLVGGTGTDTLILSNPGADETRVEVRIVTEDAVFVPEGQQTLRLRPDAVRTITLTETLRPQIRKGALGLQVTSTSPVTAALRSLVGEDLVHAPTLASTEAPTTALVPPGSARLVLARSGGAGVALVAAYGDGELLSEERVELTDGSGATLDLPPGTRLVRVTPRRTDVAGAVVITSSGGADVVPLRELVRTALIPDVRPGLPR